MRDEYEELLVQWAEAESTENNVARKERISHNKHLKKNMDDIFALQKVMIPEDMSAYVLGSGKKADIFSDFKWIKNENRKSFLSRTLTRDKNVFVKVVGVETKEKLQFPVKPTVELSDGDGKCQYLWLLALPVEASHHTSVELLEKAIAYFCQGRCKPLHKTKGIIIPGIVALRTGRYSTMSKIGPCYVLSQLWEGWGEYFPVKGKGLEKFLKSNRIYVPGLKTVKQFIAIRRLNGLLSLKLSKEEFAEKHEAFMFWMWNFGLDVGIEYSKIKDLIRDICVRRKLDFDEEWIEKAYPYKGDTYKVKNARLVEIFGENAKALFPVRPEKGTWKKRADKIRKEIAVLAQKGMSIRRIAETLGVSVSIVKRRRSEAVKLGYFDNATAIA